MTRRGLSPEQEAAHERLRPVPDRPNAFDHLRDTGKLGAGMWTALVDVKALAARRWAAGDALRRLHARGWQDPCGGKVNPLNGHEAVTARALFAEVERHVGETSWPVVVRVVIAGDSLRQCHDLLDSKTYAHLRFADDLLLDRLCFALDRAEPLLSRST